MVVPDFFIRCASSKIMHDTSSFCRIPTIRIDTPQHLQLALALARILTTLHLAVNHPTILALSGNVMDFSDEASIRESWIEDVIEKDGKEFEEPIASGSSHRVARMISICPGIGSRRQAPIRKKVQHPLIRVQFRSQENEMLKCMRQPIVIMRLSS